MREYVCDSRDNSTGCFWEGVVDMRLFAGATGRLLEGWGCFCVEVLNNLVLLDWGLLNWLDTQRQQADAGLEVMFLLILVFARCG